MSSLLPGKIPIVPRASKALIAHGKARTKRCGKDNIVKVIHSGQTKYKYKGLSETHKKLWQNNPASLWSKAKADLIEEKKIPSGCRAKKNSDEYYIVQARFLVLKSLWKRPFDFGADATRAIASMEDAK